MKKTSLKTVHYHDLLQILRNKMKRIHTYPLIDNTYKQHTHTHTMHRKKTGYLYIANVNMWQLSLRFFSDLSKFSRFFK